MPPYCCLGAYEPWLGAMVTFVCDWWEESCPPVVWNSSTHHLSVDSRRLNTESIFCVNFDPICRFESFERIFVLFCFVLPVGSWWEWQRIQHKPTTTASLWTISFFIVQTSEDTRLNLSLKGIRQKCFSCCRLETICQVQRGSNLFQV